MSVPIFMPLAVSLKRKMAHAEGQTSLGLFWFLCHLCHFFDVRFTTDRVPNHLHLPKFPCCRNQSMISGICLKSMFLPQEDMVILMCLKEFGNDISYLNN